MNPRIAVARQEPAQGTSCFNLFTRIRHLSSRILSARRIFHCRRTSCSYLICHNEYTETFPGSPMPNISTISRLVRGILHHFALNTRKEWTHASPKRGGNFQYLINIVFWFQCNLFLTNKISVRYGFVTFRLSCTKIISQRQYFLAIYPSQFCCRKCL